MKWGEKSPHFTDSLKPLLSYWRHMASFPNSIKQFIAKIAHVDKIQSADINALQEEVTAIETTLLSGTETQVLTSGSSGVPAWGARGYPCIPINSDWSVASNILNDINSIIGVANIPSGHDTIIIDILHTSGSMISVWRVYTDNGGYSWGGPGWSDYTPLSGTAIIYKLDYSFLM